MTRKVYSLQWRMHFHSLIGRKCTRFVAIHKIYATDICLNLGNAYLCTTKSVSK